MNTKETLAELIAHRKQHSNREDVQHLEQLAAEYDYYTTRLNQLSEDALECCTNRDKLEFEILKLIGFDINFARLMRVEQPFLFRSNGGLH